MAESTWDRFERAGLSREEFRASLGEISEQFRGGFIRNYAALEKRFVCGEVSEKTFNTYAALMRDDIKAVATAEKGK